MIHKGVFCIISLCIISCLLLFSRCCPLVHQDIIRMLNIAPLTKYLTDTVTGIFVIGQMLLIGLCLLTRVYGCSGYEFWLLIDVLSYSWS